MSGQDVFPTEADLVLRDAIATAFKSAHLTWIGNSPGPMIVTEHHAEVLAGIAITVAHKFRKAST